MGELPVERYEGKRLYVRFEAVGGYFSVSHRLNRVNHRVRTWPARTCCAAKVWIGGAETGKRSQGIRASWGYSCGFLGIWERGWKVDGE